MRWWRNGRRAGFRNRCPRGREGSSPSRRTHGTARQFGWRRYLGAVDELGESAVFQAAPLAGSSPVCAAAG
jgi:hypothetical protein